MPHFGGHYGEEGSRRSYVYIQTLYTDCGVKGQTAADAILEEVFDLSRFLLQNILNTENKEKDTVSKGTNSTFEQRGSGKKEIFPLYVESFQQPGSSRPSGRALMSDVFLAPALSSAPDRSSAAAQPGS